MKTQDRIKNNLDIIFKNGDLYDAISLKEGVSLVKHPILKINILLLSRILYGGVLLWEKIKRHFAPIEKVRSAQEQIRDIIGVNVDFVSLKLPPFLYDPKMRLKGKKENKYLSILYQEDDVERNNYISNLQKILNFSERYSINEIYLRLSDITDYFINIDLSSYELIDLRTVLGGCLEESLNECLLCLSTTNLRRLIQEIKCSDVYKDYIVAFNEHIEDLVIQKAIAEFEADNDLDKLKDIVSLRLNLLLNSDNSYKDRINGKVLETVSLCDEFVKVITKKQSGELIDNKTMSLYDYLGVRDYQSLMNSIDSLSDLKELYRVTSLYLYLCQTKIVKKVSSDNTLSFFDKIYKSFKLKRNKKIKNVYAIIPKRFKVCFNCLKYFFASVVTLAMVIVMSYTGLSLDLINGYFFRNPDSNIFENMVNTVFLPYKYSFELEENLFKKIMPTEDNFQDFANFFNNIFVGDSGYKNERIVATIKSFNEEVELPKYYATNYAVDSSYNNGSMEYVMNNPNTLKFSNVEPLFEISYFGGKETLRELVHNNKIDIFKTFYPLDDNYVVTKILISDLESDKVFIIDYNRARTLGDKISDAEMNYLLSMGKTQVTYTYGISANIENSFISSIQNNDFYTGNNTVKEAITNGLGLSMEASLEEIVAAIKAKKYSTTPIKDAGLTDYIKNLNENEYFEVIASLDSLVCNLAASLVVESTDDLLYVVGYKNNGDECLTTKEAHAWNMDVNENIIDATPFISDEEKSTIETIFTWGIENNIPIYAIMAFVALVIRKLFGKKIVMSLKIIKAKRVLEKPNIYEAYAKIDEVLYGGINIPRKVSKEEFIDKINDDFAGFSKDDLKDLKAKLKQEKDDRSVIDTSLKIVDEILYIRSNGEELKRALKKKNKLQNN